MYKIKFIVLMMLLAILFASKVPAFKQENLGKLKSTNKCNKCDLSQADLILANLTGANLFRVHLTGTDLSDADLKDVNLDGAILCHTIMPDRKENNSGCKK